MWPRQLPLLDQVLLGFGRRGMIPLCGQPVANSENLDFAARIDLSCRDICRADCLSEG